MTDIGKLASVSKRLKSVKVLIQPEQAAATPESAEPLETSARIGISTDLDSGRLHATPASGVEGGSSGIAELRDAVLTLAQEVSAARRGGMPLKVSEEQSQELAALTRHVAALSQSVRELVDALAVSLPNSRWYTQLLDTLSAEGPAASDQQLAEIRAHLAQQQIQLKTLLARSARAPASASPANPSPTSAPRITTSSGRLTQTDRTPKREP